MKLTCHYHLLLHIQAVRRYREKLLILMERWELGTWKLWDSCWERWVRMWVWGLNMDSVVFSLGWEGFEKWLSSYIFPKWNMEKSGFWWENHNYNLLQRGCEADYAWSNSGRYPTSLAFFKKYISARVHSFKTSNYIKSDLLSADLLLCWCKDYSHYILWWLRSLAVFKWTNR